MQVGFPRRQQIDPYVRYGAPVAAGAAIAQQVYPYVMQELVQSIKELGIAGRRYVGSKFKSTGKYVNKGGQSYSGNVKYGTRKYRRKYRRKGRRKYRRKYPNRVTPSYIKSVVSNMMNDPYKERTIASTQLNSSSNQCAYTSLGVGLTANIRSILNDAFKMLVPLGEETIDMSQVQKNLSVKFRPIKLKIRFKNNSSFGAKLHLWTIKDKVYTSNTPSTVLTSGLDADAGGDNGFETELTWWPQSVSDFRKSYKMYKYKCVDMPPGAEATYVVHTPKFTWNDDFYNIHQDSYYPWLSRHCLMRLEGVVSHSQANDDQIGIGSASIDIVYERHYTFQQQDAAKVTRYYNTNSLDTLTTATQFQAENAEEATFTQ